MNWSIPEPFYYHNKGGRTQNTWEKEWKSTHILEAEWEDVGRWVKYVHKDDDIESYREFLFFSKKDEIAKV